MIAKYQQPIFLNSYASFRIHFCFYKKEAGAFESQPKHKIGWLKGKSSIRKISRKWKALDVHWIAPLRVTF